MADKNFLTEIIDADLAEGKVSEIHTRFPPEPNGYLHIGSAKAIYINWSIANQYGADKLEAARPGIMKKLVEPNIVSKYDTLEALAKAAGIKADALKAQVEEFNKVVKAKADPVWSRYINNDQVPLVEGPWYVCELQPKVHHCMGGLLTNMKGQVLDIMDQEPIPGLYAAGEATGGVHGMVRLGTVAVADCMIFGRIAARDAFKKA